MVHRDSYTDTEKNNSLSRLLLVMRHPHTLKFIGSIFLIAVFCVMILIFYFTTILIIFIILISLSLFLGSILVHAGSVGHEFSAILKDLPVTAVEFDILRLTITFRYENSAFSIRYHALYSPYTMWIYLTQYYMKCEGPVEHYQVWMTVSEKNYFYEKCYELAKRMRSKNRLGSFLPIQPTPSDNPLSHKITEVIAIQETIPTLCYVDFAEKDNKTIIIAFLRKDASPDDIQKTMNIIQSIDDAITWE